MMDLFHRAAQSKLIIMITVMTDVKQAQGSWSNPNPWEPAKEEQLQGRCHGSIRQL